MKTLKSSLLVAALSFSMISCIIHPFAYTNPQTGGNVASLGASMLTKSKGESAYMKKGELEMGYSITGKSEVSVPNTLIWGAALSSAVSDAAASYTAKTAADEATALAATQSATQVSLAKIAAKQAAAAAKVVPVP
jgi:hypothetical protein